jgi:hypothetical protein
MLQEQRKCVTRKAISFLRLLHIAIFAWYAGDGPIVRCKFT